MSSNPLLLASLKRFTMGRSDMAGMGYAASGVVADHWFFSFIRCGVVPVRSWVASCVVTLLLSNVVKSLSCA